jgi:ribosomal protein S18 acetylase RimI-like enzyme
MRVPSPDLSIRAMKRNEVDFAIELAAKEGWNPGLHDAEYFYRTDPDGFFIGLSGNNPVGCISAVSYGCRFGFIGLYIVIPEYRGKGFGTALWQYATQHLKNQNIGLDGVLRQQENYRKSGFKLAYRNVRYQGTNFPRIAAEHELVPLVDVDFEQLAAYDSKFFAVGRKQFLEGWIRMPDSRAVAMMRERKLSGYGVIRRCREGFKVGPLFADDEKIAETLLLELSRDVAIDEPVFLDVPEVNPAAIRLVERHRMNKVFETARMYTEAPPAIELEGVFGVTTFELG